MAFLEPPNITPEQRDHIDELRNKYEYLDIFIDDKNKKIHEQQEKINQIYKTLNDFKNLLPNYNPIFK